MKIKKTVFIALLTVLCLAIMVFSAVPMTGSSTVTYDPTLDVNHDGKINMKDIAGVADSFGTNGDPTVPVNVANWPSSMNTTVTNLPDTMNVNVTNWPSQQPQSQLVWCGKYQVNLQALGSMQTVSSVGAINVTGYEKMTVVLAFSNVECAGGNSYLSAIAWWGTSPSISPPSVYDSEDILTSTFYQIANPGSVSVNPISTDSYPIKEPYVVVTPSLPASTANSVINATVDVFVYLSNGAIAGSLHKTMSWTDYEASAGGLIDFGGFTFTGFDRITIDANSNVNVIVTIYAWNTQIDSFSLNGTSAVVKTYAVSGPLIITANPFPYKPCSLAFNFYVTS